MPDTEFNPLTAVYTKTAAGQQEIASRALGLSPLVRRVLVLADGKRNGTELSAFAGGQDIGAIVTELIEKGCLEARSTAARPAAASAAAPGAPAAAEAQAADGGAAADEPLSPDLAGLPPAEMRGPKEVEMARNFMMNTVNTIFGQNTRFTLMEAIFACKTSQDTRRVYTMWAQTLSDSRIGAKRLPELREKLFQVL